MIILITDEQFSAAGTDVQFGEYVNEQLLADECGGSSLKKYILLEHYPERFGFNDSINNYYNKYYWFLKFFRSYRNANGFDAGMEQQAFKILEEGEIYSETDWGIMEQITNQFR